MLGPSCCVLGPRPQARPPFPNMSARRGALVPVGPLGSKASETALPARKAAAAREQALATSRQQKLQCRRAQLRLDC